MKESIINNRGSLNEPQKGVLIMNKIYLNQKNKDVLKKKLYNEKLNKKEMKRLYRTNCIIEKKYKNIQENKKNEDVVQDLFF